MSVPSTPIWAGPMTDAPCARMTRSAISTPSAACPSPSAGLPSDERGPFGLAWISTLSCTLDSAPIEIGAVRPAMSSANGPT
jgi:hypothetical protein